MSITDNNMAFFDNKAKVMTVKLVLSLIQRPKSIKHKVQFIGKKRLLKDSPEVWLHQLRKC